MVRRRSPVRVSDRLLPVNRLPHCHFGNFRNQSNVKKKTFLIYIGLKFKLEKLIKGEEHVKVFQLNSVECIAITTHLCWCCAFCCLSSTFSISCSHLRCLQRQVPTFAWLLESFYTIFSYALSFGCLLFPFLSISFLLQFSSISEILLSIA